MFAVIWSWLELSGHHPTPALLELWCLGAGAGSAGTHWLWLLLLPAGILWGESLILAAAREWVSKCWLMTGHSTLSTLWLGAQRNPLPCAKKTPLLLPQPSVTRAVPLPGVPSTPQHRIHVAAGTEFWVNGMWEQHWELHQDTLPCKPRCWVFSSVPC